MTKTMKYPKPHAMHIAAVAAFCLIAQIQFAGATTYYLSSSQGSDTNSGTSVEMPWMSFSRVSIKANSTNKFAPGDSILLKAGDIFNGPLRIGNSGSNGSPVTIGRYGTGTNPVIYGDHPSLTWSAVGGYSGVYSADPGLGANIEKVYDVNGQQYNVRRQGSDDLNTWLAKFVTNDWGFAYPLVYIRTPDSNPPPQMHLFEWATVYASANYITIENLDIRQGFFGIGAVAASHVISRNNSIQDGFNIGIYYGSKCSYGEIATNLVTRTGETSIYLSEGGSHWVHHNSLSYSTNSILGISLPTKPNPERCGVGLQQGTNNLVEFNSISNVYGSCFDYWLEVSSEVRYNYGYHSGGAAYPGGTGLKLHNNVFNLDGAGPGIGGSHEQATNSPAPDAGPNLIYNNVIYNFKNYGFYSGSNVSSGVVFRNNILIVTSNTQALVQLNPGVDADYNSYYCTAGSPKGWFWNNVNYSTLAGFRAASGQDAHSIYADPQFLSANPLSAADFRLKLTSPCINKGLDLKLAGLLSSAQEYKDYLGTLIPQGAGPDIGAYEKIFSPVLPPTDFRIEQP